MSSLIKSRLFFFFLIFQNIFVHSNTARLASDSRLRITLKQDGTNVKWKVICFVLLRFLKWYRFLWRTNFKIKKVYVPLHMIWGSKYYMKKQFLKPLQRVCCILSPFLSYLLAGWCSQSPVNGTSKLWWVNSHLSGHHWSLTRCEIWGHISTVEHIERLGQRNSDTSRNISPRVSHRNEVIIWEAVPLDLLSFRNREEI